MLIEITQITCCKCDVVWWVTVEHDNQLIDSHKTFYCPHGHPQSYKGKTEAQKNKEQADRYTKWYRQEMEKTERLTRSNAALRGVITRKKNQEKQ